MLVRTLVRDERTNAAVGWALTGVMALVAVASLFAGPVLWGVFVLGFIAVVAAPALMTAEWTTIVPWPLLAVGTIVTTLRALDRVPEVAGPVAVATLALVAVVELDAFTAVEMSRRFAVGFAVLTTLAVEGVWIVAQFISDLWLGTAFIESQRELQWDIVGVTLVAFAMGAVAIWYFDRFEHVGSHGPPTDAGTARP